MFTTEFTNTRHPYTFSARSIQSMPHITSRRPILILSSHLRLGLPSGLFSPHVSPLELCMNLSTPPIRATCSAHLIFFCDLITRIAFGRRSADHEARRCVQSSLLIVEFLTNRNADTHTHTQVFAIICLYAYSNVYVIRTKTPTYALCTRSHAHNTHINPHALTHTHTHTYPSPEQEYVLNNNTS